jgi:hypothetical protein
VTAGARLPRERPPDRLPNVGEPHMRGETSYGRAEPGSRSGADERKRSARETWTTSGGRARRQRFVNAGV